MKLRQAKEGSIATSAYHVFHGQAKGRKRKRRNFHLSAGAQNMSGELFEVMICGQVSLAFKWRRDRERALAVFLRLYPFGLVRAHSARQEIATASAPVLRSKRVRDIICSSMQKEKRRKGAGKMCRSLSAPSRDLRTGPGSQGDLSSQDLRKNKRKLQNLARRPKSCELLGVLRKAEICFTF